MIALLLPSLTLIIGAGLLWIWQRAAPAHFSRYARWVTAALVGLTMLFLLTNTGGAPWHITTWSSLPTLTPPLELQINRPGRLLGLALAALVLSSLLSARPAEETESPGSTPGIRSWVMPLLGLAVALLTLLPTNLLTLALAWTAFDCVLGVIVWRSPSADEFKLKSVWAAGAIGTFFLWGAATALQAGYNFQNLAALASDEGGAIIMLLVAILLRLAPYPFHLASRLPTSESVMRIIPLATGVWPLTRIPDWISLPPSAVQVISALLLTGLVISGLLSWLSSTDRQVVRWVVRGQAAIVALAGCWAGPAAALAEGMVLILAGGLLTLYADRETLSLENRIAGGIGVAALAGLPLTWGGDGRLFLFQTWLQDGWALYLFLASGAYLLLLSAAGRLLLRSTSPPECLLERFLAGLALGVLAAGLLLRSSPLSQADGWSWLALLFPTAGSAAIIWGFRSRRPLRELDTDKLQPALALDWLPGLMERIGGGAGRAIHAVHDVLEGESALLWVLILLAVGWLLLAP